MIGWFDEKFSNRQHDRRIAYSTATTYKPTVMMATANLVFQFGAASLRNGIDMIRLSYANLRFDRDI